MEWNKSLGCLPFGKDGLEQFFKWNNNNDGARDPVPSSIVGIRYFIDFVNVTFKPELNFMEGFI